MGEPATGQQLPWWMLFRSSAAFSHRISTSPDRPISFTLPPFLRLDPIEDQYRLDTQKIATVWDGFYKDHDFLVYIVKLPGG